MATPRRRSSRLQGVAAPKPFGSTTPMQKNKLSSLLERDESPDEGVAGSIDAIVAPRTTPQGRGPALSSGIKTPRTLPRPPFAEMHPSKVQQSTEKNEEPKATPSKPYNHLANRLTSPTFEFSFDRQDSDLSSEAQKIMDSVREEAARIKAQMLADKKIQDEKEGRADQMEGHDAAVRKIATPKRKAGRFSDAHKQQFRKMDSIAQHASTWKTQMSPEAKTSLKRSPSKAGLDEKATPRSLPQSKSMRSLYSTGDDQQSPGKRVRRDFLDDVSSARPVSRDANESDTPAKLRLEPKLPSAISTPTKASLARSASVKSLKTTSIPGLSRSSSTKQLSGPSQPRTEGSLKYLSSLSRLGSMKSIMHRQLQSPSKVAATGEMQARNLPSLPSSPSKMYIEQSKVPTEHPSPKRVTFADRPIPNSPSKSHIPTPRKLPPLPTGPAESSNAKDRLPVASAGEVSYPTIAFSPNITTRKPVSSDAGTSGPADFTFRAAQTIKFADAVPTTSTSQANTDVANALTRPLPAQPVRQQHRPTIKTRTIRHVRPSGLPTPLGSSSSTTSASTTLTMPGSFEPMLPPIAHGIDNKKRKHVESEDEDDDMQDDESESMLQDSDIENQPPRHPLVQAKPAPPIFHHSAGNAPKRAASEMERGDDVVHQQNADLEQPRAKKQRLDHAGSSGGNTSTTTASPSKLHANNMTSPLKKRRFIPGLGGAGYGTGTVRGGFGGGGRPPAAPGSTSTSPKKGLSLGRLNMLARPKERR